jgi:CO/xanthine dehydrogenase Mo-binding subunit
MLPIHPWSPMQFWLMSRSDKVTIWASTQAPFRVRATAAETLGMPEEKIRVITPFVGGGFGGKKSGQQISDVVKLSKITGRPVQIAGHGEKSFFTMPIALLLWFKWSPD